MLQPTSALDPSSLSLALNSSASLCNIHITVGSHKTYLANFPPAAGGGGGGIIFRGLQSSVGKSRGIWRNVGFANSVLHY